MFKKSLDKLFFEYLKKGDLEKLKQTVLKIKEDKKKNRDLYDKIVNDSAIIHYVITKGNHSIILYLYELLKDKNITHIQNTILYYLITFDKKYNYIDIIQYVLDDPKHNINNINKNGNSYLHVAVLHNNVGVINILMNKYINVTLNNNNETAGSLAIVHGDFNIYNKINNYQNKINENNEIIIKEINQLIKKNKIKLKKTIQKVLNVPRIDNQIFTFDLIKENDSLNLLIDNFHIEELENDLKTSFKNLKLEYSNFKCSELEKINKILNDEILKRVSNDNFIGKIRKKIFNKKHEIDNYMEEFI